MSTHRKVFTTLSGQMWEGQGGEEGCISRISQIRSNPDPMESSLQFQCCTSASAMQLCGSWPRNIGNDMWHDERQAKSCHPHGMVNALRIWPISVAPRCLRDYRRLQLGLAPWLARCSTSESCSFFPEITAGNHLSQLRTTSPTAWR